jgi:hypothetical protein
VKPERAAQLLAMPTRSNDVDEDRAIVWDEPVHLTEAQADAFVALLTLDGPEAVPVHRARWAALAEQARADMRRRDRRKS